MKRAALVLAKRLQERDGSTFNIGDSIATVQVKGPYTRDSENVASPDDLVDGSPDVDRSLYFNQKMWGQIEKMIKYYLGPKTTSLVKKLYKNALSIPDDNKNVFEMLGGNEKKRRKLTVEESYENESCQSPVKKERKSSQSTLSSFFKPLKHV